jgi:hypothetical protein
VNRYSLCSAVWRQSSELWLVVLPSRNLRWSAGHSQWNDRIAFYSIDTMVRLFTNRFWNPDRTPLIAFLRLFVDLGVYRPQIYLWTIQGLQNYKVNPESFTQFCWKRYPDLYKFRLTAIPGSTPESCWQRFQVSSRIPDDLNPSRPRCLDFQIEFRSIPEAESDSAYIGVPNQGPKSGF